MPAGSAAPAAGCVTSMEAAALGNARKWGTATIPGALDSTRSVALCSWMEMPPPRPAFVQPAYCEPDSSVSVLTISGPLEVNRWRSSAIGVALVALMWQGAQHRGKALRRWSQTAKQMERRKVPAERGRTKVWWCLAQTNLLPAAEL